MLRRGVFHCLVISGILKTIFSGALGGIVVFWYSRVIQLVDVEEGSFSLSCHFRNTKDKSSLVLRVELWCYRTVELFN